MFYLFKNQKPKLKVSQEYPVPQNETECAQKKKKKKMRAHQKTQELLEGALIDLIRNNLVPTRQ